MFPSCVECFQTNNVGKFESINQALPLREALAYNAINTCRETPWTQVQKNEQTSAALNEQSQVLNDEQAHTYAVLIVDIVNLVDSEPLPLVQLLFLQGIPDISNEKPLRYSRHAQKGSNENKDDSGVPWRAFWLSNERHLARFSALTTPFWLKKTKQKSISKVTAFAANRCSANNFFKWENVNGTISVQDFS